MTRLDHLANVCPTCHDLAGHVCITSLGYRLTTLHVGRRIAEPKPTATPAIRVEVADPEQVAGYVLGLLRGVDDRRCGAVCE